jgi:hypothetical protein
MSFSYSPIGLEFLDAEETHVWKAIDNLVMVPKVIFDAIVSTLLTR